MNSSIPVSLIVLSIILLFVVLYLFPSAASDCREYGHLPGRFGRCLRCRREIPNDPPNSN